MIASLTDGSDLRQSSTNKFRLTVLATYEEKWRALSSAVFRRAKFEQAGDDTAPNR